MSESHVIRPARGADDLDDVAALFRAYQAWLQADVCFQNFEAELAALPGDYAPPGGEIWLARIGGRVVGVNAVKPLEAGSDRLGGRFDEDRVCEMKRLYVIDSARGTGIGRALAYQALAWAREAGYGAMVLETLQHLTAARDLYRTMGFVEYPPEGDNALELPIFMAKAKI